MGSEDQQHWDERYRALDNEHVDVALAGVFEDHVALLARARTVFEIACGGGRSAVWFAQQGASVTACDISPVAIELAQRLAAESGVASRCNFVVADLDEGLPPGPLVDLVFCSMFRDEALDQALIDRVQPGGLLAIACLSEVGAAPGRFRATPGDLLEAFADLDVVAHTEADGVAMLVGRKILR